MYDSEPVRLMPHYSSHSGKFIIGSYPHFQRTWTTQAEQKKPAKARVDVVAKQKSLVSYTSSKDKSHD
jgi:hypothetical protein